VNIPPETSAPGRKAPRLPRNVVLLALASLCADVSSEMLYPILPLFLTQHLGAPASVEGIAEATQNVIQGFSGWLADRMQRNKPVAVFGFALSAVGKPIMGLAMVWPQVLVGRLADRLGAGTRSAPRDALIAASVDDARRGAAFGLEGLGDNLGAVAGPLLAAGLLYALGVDLRWIFFLAFLPGLLTVLLVAAVIEPTRRSAPAAGTEPRRLRDLPPVYWKYLLSMAVFGVGNSSNAFIILKANSVGISTEQTLLVYAGFNLVAALASYPVGERSDAWGRKRLLLGALGVFLLAYLGLAFSSNPLVVGLLFVLYGAYQGAFRTVGKALATDLAPPPLRASALGLYASTVGLSALVASTVGGQLWVQIGPASRGAPVWPDSQLAAGHRRRAVVVGRKRHGARHARSAVSRRRYAINGASCRPHARPTANLCSRTRRSCSGSGSPGSHPARPARGDVGSGKPDHTS
jgi:MFS family permease